MATQVEVAAHLDLSDRQVRNLLADGVLPGSKGAGGLDVDACRMAYIRYLRGLSSGQVRRETPEVAGDDIDPLAEAKLTQERLRLTSAQADTAELKNEQLRRKLVPVEFLSFALPKVVAPIATSFDTLLMNIRRRAPDVPPRVLDIIEREAVKTRNECARFGENVPELIDEFLDSTEQGSSG